MSALYWDFIQMQHYIKAAASRSIDLLNSMIYDLKRFEDLRWLFDPVQHSSLDDLVCQAAGVTNQSNCS